MPRRRNPENKGLPTRWQQLHGAYYYQVPPGLEPRWGNKKKFRLGATLPEAYATWAARLGDTANVKTIGRLLERYTLEVVPKKTVPQQVDDRRYIRRLTVTFGPLVLTDMRPQLVYQFHDKAKAKTAAKRAIAVLSHAFTKAVEWGYIDEHPFKGEVRLEGNAPRERYVEDWEIIESLKIKSRRKKGSVRAIQAYIRIKLLTGMSKGDLLRLQPARDFDDEGIHIQRHKTAKRTGKRTIYEWSEDLRAAVQMAIEARPVDMSPWLFCNDEGECHYDEKTERPNGWNSMWQRFMVRVLAETKVTERFTDHDLRAKCGSDAESLEHARALLNHVDNRTTQRFYRRKAERVKPLR